MEGSTNSKNVSNYTKLSEYYDDLLMDKKAYDYWLEYIEAEPFKTVLELASGSGVLTGILEEKGYEIVASDICEQMKIASRKNFQGEYLILNMINYNLDRKFDLILCLCDSINYLQADELDSFIQCAYKHLNNNGRLIFDMHNVKRLEEFEEQYIEEGTISGVNYQWTIMSDIDNTISEHFTFYTDEGMIQENHTQNVFEIDLIKEKMNKLFDTTIIEDFIIDEKVLVVGKKI